MVKSALAESGPSEPEPVAVKVAARAGPMASVDRRAIDARELRVWILENMGAIPFV
jgi:hypothetical protein